MKRQLLFLVLAGGLALMTAPNASAGKPATVPGYCGNNYAMLMTGDEPNPYPALGSAAGFPGALTAIVGLGVIQFSKDCSSISGELIYNDGDIQYTVSGIGADAGPASCYSSVSLLSAGLPCFDGANHFTAASITTAGEPPGMALLQFIANFNYFDLSVGSPAGSLPFAFTIQETAGDSTLVGVTVPSPTAPVLTLTMQEQSPIGSLNPVPTTFGQRPYAGNSAIICTGYGANDDDLIANISNSNSGGVTGSYGTAVGSVNISSNGQGSGVLSFNSNDNLQVSGSTAPPSNNTDCTFTEVLDPNETVTPQAFGDGTSNIFTTITSPSTDPSCTNAAIAGAGFTTSQVAWGSFDSNSYATVTGLTETAIMFIPPGEMSTCTHLAD